MRDTTFREILEKKLQAADASTHAEGPKHDPKDSTVQPFRLESTYDSLLLCPPRSSPRPSHYNRYPSPPKRRDVHPAGTRSTIKPRRPTPRVSVQLLSVEARIALATLGLEPGETISHPEVRRAFHRLAKRLHPDIATDEAWRAAREPYLLAQEAYDLVAREIASLSLTTTEKAAA